MSSQSQKAKKGLGCLRGPEVVNAKMKMKNDNEQTSQQKDLILQLLGESNKMNSNLTKCFVQVKHKKEIIIFFWCNITHKSHPLGQFLDLV